MDFPDQNVVHPIDVIEPLEHDDTRLAAEALAAVVGWIVGHGKTKKLSTIAQRAIVAAEVVSGGRLLDGSTLKDMARRYGLDAGMLAWHRRSFEKAFPGYRSTQQQTRERSET